MASDRGRKTNSVGKDDAARFTDRVIVRCPASLPLAIDIAAAKNLMKPSEYVRRAVIERLKADGIDPASPKITEKRRAEAMIIPVSSVE